MSQIGHLHSSWGVSRCLSKPSRSKHVFCWHSCYPFWIFTYQKYAPFLELKIPFSKPCFFDIIVFWYPSFLVSIRQFFRGVYMPHPRHQQSRLQRDFASTSTHAAQRQGSQPWKTGWKWIRNGWIYSSSGKLHLILSLFQNVHFNFDQYVRVKQVLGKNCCKLYCNPWKAQKNRFWYMCCAFLFPIFLQSYVCLKSARDSWGLERIGNESFPFGRFPDDLHPPLCSSAGKKGSLKHKKTNFWRRRHRMVHRNMKNRW